MGIFDFFRKKEKIEIKEKEKIEFSSLGTKIAAETKNNKEKRSLMNKEIKNSLEEFRLKLKGNMESLQKIDIDSKKESERVRFIVKENLKIYIEQLNRFISNLEGINSEDYILKIPQVAENFKTTSVHSLERVTILIGREIDLIKQDLKEFFEKFNSIVSENKNLFEKEKQFEKLQNTLEELEKRKKFEAEIKELIKSLENNKERREMEKIEIEGSVKQMKEGEDYKNTLKERENVNEEIRKNDELLLKIKQELDIKALAKQFHGEKKKEIMLSELNKDFIAYVESNKIELIKLILEAKPKFDISKINEVLSKREQLKKREEAEIIKNIQREDEEIKKIEIELFRIEDLIKNENDKVGKIQEKIAEKEKEAEIISKSIWEDAEIIINN